MYADGQAFMQRVLHANLESLAKYRDGENLSSDFF